MRHRFHLWVRHTFEVDLENPLLSREAVDRQVNHDFGYILKEYIPGLVLHGHAAAPENGPGPHTIPLNTDEDVRRYMSSLPCGFPILDVRIPDVKASVVAKQYQQTLASNCIQIQRLQEQVTELRQQGYGSQQGFSMLQQYASLQDDGIVTAVSRQGMGIQPCVTAMVGNPKDPWANQQGLRVMALYGNGSLENQQEIYHTGGFKTVVQAMTAFPDDPTTQHYAARLIAETSSIPEHAQEWHDARAVEPIVRNLEAFQQDPRVQQHCTRALGALAQNPTHRDNVVKAGGMQALVNSMRYFPQDVHVNKHALEALRPLAQSHAGEMIQAGVAPAVIQALQSHRNDAQVAVSGLSTLAELAGHRDCREQLHSASTVPVILTTMQAFANSSVVQECGLRCLATLAEGSTDAQNLIFQAQGVPMVLHAIQQATSSGAKGETATNLIAEGLNLVANLSANPECRSHIAQTGGVESALGAMREHPQCAPIQAHSMRVLAGLGSMTEIGHHLIKQGTPEAIVRGMQNCTSDVAVQMHGCYA
mmetsp:Transcript_31715/g.87591  ORF Transcript_31715/g.87591 Transcript_31715/m.87591 type:complete len:534 (+) Transcript_31715:125-1726(+)